jgi:Holliday junction resolvase-like predicted endonuclease
LGEVTLPGFPRFFTRFYSFTLAMKPPQDENNQAKLASKKGKRANRVGIWAERATLWLLWLKGWDLVAWRQKSGRYELDLLVSRGSDLRLIEVKARGHGAWVSADIALTDQQRLRLQKALRHWLDQVPWPGNITFQRVSWSGFLCKFHTHENWESLGVRRYSGDTDGESADFAGNE